LPGGNREIEDTHERKARTPTESEDTHWAEIEGRKSRTPTHRKSRTPTRLPGFFFSESGCPGLFFRTVRHRELATKTNVLIIHFVDTSHSALLRMWDKPQRGYKAMGYRMA
jgi:hypothetical protein